ncbi:MAG: hypothetical protein K9M75_12790 [Phycisphaerae bacterium]|nr:hypothetical protein [Phycisphaerae bacterium]
MSIEFFTEEGRGFEPKVSIRKQGQIGLNQGAVKRFNIKETQYVLLGYDKERKMIAIKLIDKQQKGARKGIVRENNCSIAAKGFFDFFSIPYAESKSFEAKLDPDSGCIVFFLEKEEDEIDRQTLL